MNVRAIRIDRLGGPEVLQVREIPCPTLEAGEVLVRSVASSINPIDRKLRTIERGLKLPLTLGWDLSGVIVESTVPQFHPGDRVVAMSHVLNTRTGTWADLVALPAADVATAPARVPLTEAASLPLAGLTALQGWRSLDIPGGARVLVVGAAGAIGGFAVQLAVDGGVTVDGLVRHTDHFDEVGELGAHKVTMDPLELPAGTYDAVFDTVGLAGTAVDMKRLLTSGGRYVTSQSAGELPDSPGARRVHVQQDPVGLDTLVRMVDDGALRMRVAARYSLEKVREAHQRFEAGGLLGKVVLMF